MSLYGTFRSNWRVIILVILLAGSAVALFAPGGVGGSGPQEGPTNLQYGIELDGGTRIRAPVVGVTAEDLQITQDPGPLEEDLAAAFGTDAIDVSVRPAAGTVEVFARGVTEEEFISALQEAGLSVTEENVRQGVSDQTRDQMVRAIDRKISAAGLSGATARQVTTATGQRFIVVQAPNRDVDDLRSLLSNRGTVRVVAYYPNESGFYVNETVLEQDDFSNIGVPQQNERQGPHVPVTVQEDEAEDFANAMAAAGFGEGSTCNFEGYGSLDPTVANPDRCLLVVSDNDVVDAFGVEPSLGRSFASGEFVNDPSFIMTVPGMSSAQRLAINLRAGALPAPLDFDGGTTYSLEPALAERFKVNSAITGLIAVLAVAGVVFLRYGNPTVAAPMVVTALSEVVVLLGFAASVGLALDLSHIAGLIAVIGTGVDDLIIIADEVMAEGDVSSGRVFQSRFRKAFWVIGAAAVTTVIALSPLAILSLGDLRGFAIVTIVGVFIGVLITRPAYGDILRALLTKR